MQILQVDSQLYEQYKEILKVFNDDVRRYPTSNEWRQTNLGEFILGEIVNIEPKLIRDALDHFYLEFDDLIKHWFRKEIIYETPSPYLPKDWIELFFYKLAGDLQGQAFTFYFNGVFPDRDVQGYGDRLRVEDSKVLKSVFENIYSARYVSRTGNTKDYGAIDWMFPLLNSFISLDQMKLLYRLSGALISRDLSETGGGVSVLECFNPLLKASFESDFFSDTLSLLQSVGLDVQLPHSITLFLGKVLEDEKLRADLQLSGLKAFVNELIDVDPSLEIFDSISQFLGSKQNWIHLQSYMDPTFLRDHSFKRGVDFLEELIVSGEFEETILFFAKIFENRLK
jgi:hypothetical protein